MVSSEGEGLKDGAERRVKWGDREGTQEEYDAFLEGERERLDKDPELVRFMERVRGVEGKAADDLSEAYKGRREEPTPATGKPKLSKAKGSPRSLYLSDETWEALLSMAVEAGFIRADKPNVSAFIDAWVWNNLER